MKPLILFFLFFFFLTSFVSAFDCTYFSDQDECLFLNDYNESLIANLIYTNTSFPNHNLISNYNDNIHVTLPPEDTIVESNGNLKNVWFVFLTASPSIIYEDELFVNSLFTLRSEYDFEYSVPSTYVNNRKRSGRTCKIRYYFHSQSDNLKIYANNNYLSNQKISMYSISNPTIFKGVYTASVTIKKKYYKWRYHNGWSCKYSQTKYDTDTLSVDDTFEVVPYAKQDEPKFIIQQIYNDNFVGEKNNSNKNLEIVFDNSYYKESFFSYEAVFSKEPYYFLTLKAINNTFVESKNLFLYKDKITVKNNDTCLLNYNNFFETKTIPCTYELDNLNLTQFQKQEFSNNWNLLFLVAIFIFVLWLFYTAIKKTWGKTILPVLITLILIPSVKAESCGLTNLATCIPEKIYSFFINLLNAPLQPLLSTIRSLLENAPSIDLFQGVWAVMVYCISFFYGLLFMYAGFQFIFSGHNIIKREMAKEWLKNTVLMIVFIQASFYIYTLVLDLGAVMSSAVLSLVNEQFFLLTADNLMNMGLEFLFVTLYAITLLITLLLLLIRYLIVSFGVIFLPIGIFCYFVPPLRSYGKLILHLLGSFIFITFIYSLIILGCSLIAELPIFENVKIMIMISCFTIINLLFIIITIKAIFKATFSGGNGGGEIAQVVKYIGMMV
ncbi:MAG: hypothetical protein ABH828_01060 [archaeon]